MPHFLGNTVVVTKEELIPNFWNTYDALAKAIKRSEKRGYGIKRFMYGGNKRKLMVLFDTLPPRVKEELGDPRVPNHILEDYYSVDGDAVEYYNSYVYPDGSYLKPDTIDKLIINASVLSSLMKLEAAREREIISKNGKLKLLEGTDLKKIQKIYCLNKFQAGLNKLTPICSLYRLFDYNFDFEDIDLSVSSSSKIQSVGLMRGLIKYN